MSSCLALKAGGCIPSAEVVAVCTLLADHTISHFSKRGVCLRQHSSGSKRRVNSSSVAEVAHAARPQHEHTRSPEDLFCIVSDDIGSSFLRERLLLELGGRHVHADLALVLVPGFPEGEQTGAPRSLTGQVASRAPVLGHAPARVPLSGSIASMISSTPCFASQGGAKPPALKRQQSLERPMSWATSTVDLHHQSAWHRHRTLQ